MASICKGLLQIRWQPQVQISRYKSKIRITKPNPPHYQRAIVEELCKPYFLKERRLNHIPRYEECDALKITEQPPHESEIVFAREALNWFKNSRLIAFFQKNIMEPEEDFKAKLSLKKINIRCKYYNKRVIEFALKGSIYEAALPLFESHTVIGLSSDTGDNVLNNLLKVSTKLPKLILMAAIIDNRLLSYSEIQYFGQFTSLDEVRLSLVGTLNSASQNLVQQINHHPNNLVQLLQQHQEVNKDKIGKS